MNRQQKETVVESVEKLLKESPATFLVNYKGLSVAQLQSLRRGLREKQGFLKVTKARLMKIAAHNAASKIQEFDSFKENFKEQIGLVFSKGENTPGVAKTLVDFAQSNEALSVLSVLFENKILSKEQIKQLATLPSRDVLLAMLAGSLQAPISKLARTLRQLINCLAYSLQQIVERQGKDK